MPFLEASLWKNSSRLNSTRIFIQCGGDLTSGSQIKIFTAAECLFHLTMLGKLSSNKQNRCETNGKSIKKKAQTYFLVIVVMFQLEFCCMGQTYLLVL